MHVMCVCTREINIGSPGCLSLKRFFLPVPKPTVTSLEFEVTSSSRESVWLQTSEQSEPQSTGYLQLIVACSMQVADQSTN